MDTDLVKRVSDIIFTDNEKEILDESETFCGRMNDFFSFSDFSTVTADAAAFINILETKTYMKAIIPPEIMDGLKKHIYKFNQTNGEYLAQIVNSEGGGIVKNLRLEEVTELANPAGLSTLAIQLAVQMKLFEIKDAIDELSVQVNRKLNAVIQSQVDGIVSKADAVLSEFERFKCHPEFNVQPKDVLGDIDEVVPLLKRDILNRINTITQIDSKKNNILFHPIKKDDEIEAEKNVSYIHDEINYLQILFIIKVYMTKDINDFNAYSNYLSTTFTEDTYFMLNSWEYLPDNRNKKNRENTECFWAQKFPLYLQKIQNKSKDLLALEEA